MPGWTLKASLVRTIPSASIIPPGIVAKADGETCIIPKDWSEFDAVRGIQTITEHESVQRDEFEKRLEVLQEYGWLITHSLSELVTR